MLDRVSSNDFIGLNREQPGSRPIERILSCNLYEISKPSSFAIIRELFNDDHGEVTMNERDETGRVESPHQGFRIRREIVWVSLATFAFLFVLHTYLIQKTSGTGTIVEKISRSGNVRNEQGKRLPQGLFIKTDTGAEIRLPPGKIWDKVHKGDRIRKEKGSFTYWINGKAISALPWMIQYALSMAVFVFIFLTLTHYLFTRFQKSSRSPGP